MLDQRGVQIGPVERSRSGVQGGRRIGGRELELDGRDENDRGQLAGDRDLYRRRGDIVGDGVPRRHLT
jgi:hypothetical protein